VFVVEFKVEKNATAEKALEQIDTKGYLIPFTANGNQLVKAGVAFSEEKGSIGRWVTV
jgi:hypothetical protein